MCQTQTTCSKMIVKALKDTFHKPLKFEGSLYRQFGKFRERVKDNLKSLFAAFVPNNFKDILWSQIFCYQHFLNNEDIENPIRLLL